MRPSAPLHVSSSERPGRLVPDAAKVLRSRCIVLETGQAVEWHTTGGCEELLIALRGRVHVERRVAAGRRRRTIGAISRRLLVAGACAFIPQRTVHRVVNRGRGVARYIYVTAPRARHR